MKNRTRAAKRDLPSGFCAAKKRAVPGKEDGPARFYSVVTMSEASTSPALAPVSVSAFEVTSESSDV